MATTTPDGVTHPSSTDVFDRAFLDHTTECERCQDEFGQREHIQGSDEFKARGIVHAYGCEECRSRFPSVANMRYGAETLR